MREETNARSCGKGDKVPLNYIAGIASTDHRCYGIVCGQHKNEIIAKFAETALRVERRSMRTA